MNVNPINFTSRHISSFNVQNQKTKENETLNFVQYECNPEDLEKLTDALEEKDSIILGEQILGSFFDVYNGFDERAQYKRFYGVENSKGEVLAACEADTKMPYLSLALKMKDEENLFLISRLVTLPKNRHGSEDREYKGLGAKMTSEIIKEAKNENAEKITLACGNDKFWDTIPFFYRIYSGTFRVLDKKDFDNCTKSLDLKA